MYEAGMKPRDIAAREGVPADSIRGIVARYTNQISTQSQPRSRRPTIITDRQKRIIIRIITNNPFIKNADLLRETGLTCEIRTLTRWLKTQGIKHHTAL